MTTAVTHCVRILLILLASNVELHIRPADRLRAALGKRCARTLDPGVPALLTSLRKHERYRHHFGGVRASSDSRDWQTMWCVTALHAPDQDVMTALRKCVETNRAA